jgi:diacylglycerol kinase family enzyme
MDHLFVINPGSFSAQPQAMDAFRKRVRERLEGKGNFEIFESRFARDMVLPIRDAIRRRKGDTRLRVYACGGDGTSYGCLNALDGAPNTELAIIPFGEGNDFARAFGKQGYAAFKDLDAQLHAQAVPMDILRVNESLALNFCAVGAEAKAALRLRKVSPWLRNYGATYKIIGCFTALGRAGVQEYRITVNDSEVLEGNFAAINVANGPCYGAGISAIPEAAPLDGALDLVASYYKNKLSLFFALMAYTRGKHSKIPKVCEYRSVQKVKVESDLPLCVNTDGEVFYDSEVTIEVVKGGVNFVCAAPFPARFGYV